MREERRVGSGWGRILSASSRAVSSSLEIGSRGGGNLSLGKRGPLDGSPSIVDVEGDRGGETYQVNAFAQGSTSGLRALPCSSDRAML